MKLSVVIPVYNGEKYLDECLRSASEQRVDDMEIIVIDDGSTDASHEIAREWARNDSRFVVARFENGGLGAARNRGIDMARGETIGFLDADDMAEPGTFGFSLDAMEATGADIVEWGFRSFGAGGERLFPGSGGNLFRIFSGRDAALTMKGWNHVVWNKIYKRRLWEAIRFPEGVLHEDMFVNYRLYLLAEKVLRSGEPLYRYRRHAESLTGRRYSATRTDLLAARNQQVGYIRGTGDRVLLRDAEDRRIRDTKKHAARCLENGLVLRGLGLAAKAGLLVAARPDYAFSAVSMRRARRGAGPIFEVISRSGESAVRKSRKALRHARKIVLFLEPDHGNTGDHAIALGERLLISRAFPGVLAVSVSFGKTERFLERYADSIGADDLLLLHGGGNIGNEYPDQERLRRLIVRTFPDNRVISLPQTVAFRHGIVVEEVAEASWRTYASHHGLTLVAREKKSLEAMERLFPGTDVRMFPDSALLLDGPEPSVRSGVVLCLRNDSEGLVSARQKLRLIEAVRESGMEYRLTDTFSDRKIAGRERRAAVDETMRRFAGAEFVVTDRLHGVVFSILAKSPCIAIDNANGKVKAFLEQWCRGAGVSVVDSDGIEGIAENLAGLMERTCPPVRPRLEEQFEAFSEFLREAVRAA